MKIYIKNNDVDKALRTLKKKMLAEGDIKAFREQQFFIPNTVTRRLEEKAGKARWVKKRIKIEENRVKAEQAAFHKNRKKKSTNPINKRVA